MQILHASPVSVPQFASLSFLLKQNSSNINNDAVVSMGEPMMVASPFATLTSNASRSALRELHTHVTMLQKAATVAPNKVPPQDRFALEMLLEDQEKLLSTAELQVFRPRGAKGICLYYRLLYGDDKQLSSLSSHIMASTKMGAKSGSASNNAIPSGLLGIIFCVAMSGIPSACRSSGLAYSLPQRMNDCTLLLTKIQDAPSAKVVLSTFLLTEDELRINNEMALAPDVVVFPEAADDAEKAKGLLSPMAGLVSPLALKRGAGGGGDALGGDGANGEKPSAGVTLSLRPNSAAAALEMTERLTVLSVAETDTFLRKYSRGGQERKANLDLTGGGKSRFRRGRKGELARDADLDNFDYKGPAKVIKKKSIHQSIDDTGDDNNTRASSEKPQLRQPKKDTKTKTTPVPTLKSSRSDIGGGNRKMTGGASVGEDSFDPFSPQQTPQRQQRPSAAQNRRRGSTSASGYDHNDDVSLISDGRSTAMSSVGSHSRMQVNIALNEDLSCSYKLSQLSSCTVEGVVQIQVKTTLRSPGPFFLHVRDPSGHVDVLQENKKFAEDVSATLSDEADADHRFAVSIPKGDNYFPVLRYKCGGDLRPVPIRVQTRVKVDDRIARVALQISSNPNNEASLTDLTIIMGVPDEVRGESLITQPAGGVWNETKRSVIWCVAELGSGEKFQLQARFDVDDAYDPDDEKPKFPVLVRCQCLFAQLSDVELEVKDIPDRHSPDVVMKLARRFRLSHRERS